MAMQRAHWTGRNRKSLVGSLRDWGRNLLAPSFLCERMSELWSYEVMSYLRLRVRYFLALWLFVLSAVAFLDRTNISIAGLEISHEYGLNTQALGWIFSSFLIGYAGFQIPA